MIKRDVGLYSILLLGTIFIISNFYSNIENLVLRASRRSRRRGVRDSRLCHRSNLNTSGHGNYLFNPSGVDQSRPLWDRLFTYFPGINTKSIRVFDNVYGLHCFGISRKQHVKAASNRWFSHHFALNIQWSFFCRLLLLEWKMAITRLLEGYQRQVQTRKPMGYDPRI